MTGTTIGQKNQNIVEIIKSYYQITKPRIIPLLLITTASSMWIASRGKIDPLLLINTLIGGTLAAASAQTFNCIYDKDIDYEMERTRNRPIPSGKIQPFHALIFGIILACLSFTILALFVNLNSAILALSGIGFYMIIYTHFLKRHTIQNIVIGGAAGSIPPLVGWAAVTGELTLTAWILFTIIFLWTPPHFWALALMIKDDYAQVNVPMLPVIKGEKVTAINIWIYTLLVIPFSLLLVYPLGVSGIFYGAIAVILGAIFLKKAWLLKKAPKSKQLAKEMFKFSIFYMMLLSFAMVIDSLPITSQLINKVFSLFL